VPIIYGGSNHVPPMSATSSIFTQLADTGAAQHRSRISLLISSGSAHV
jgi:hypothetical protein